MPKLGIFSGNELCKILAAHGFQEVRRPSGSHMIMQRIIDSRTITVPIPNHRQVKIGTLQSIIRQSELPRDLFLK
ncbi:MAG TPA: type II toxin-antitoxin system HicA family toxin [Candidatus Kapabacteria bacterium]|jgi:predicted RNA binding protein YcfA (HicA-like mRNA interferase family)|nr:type II toxin-antitoxin system HicA family toxin [Candidatus Kapabacteria bacterium]